MITFNYINAQFMRLTIPVRFEDFSVRNQSEYKKFIKELPEFSNNSILLRLLDEKNYLKEIKFSFITGWEEILKIYAKYPYAQQTAVNCFLMIDFTLDLPKDGMEYSEHSYADLYLKRLLLLINLSYVLPVNFLRCVEDNEKKMHHILNFIDWGYDHMQKIQWPQINASGLNCTLNWFQRHKINLHTLSISPASRAINAFSNIFVYSVDESPMSQLFWCMLGIEALYAEGNQGIGNQIRQKVKTVLGEPDEFKKKLTKLYEYRSKLIHGDLDFPAKFAIDTYKVYDANHLDYIGFAVSILLSSIQVLIANDIDKFEFEFLWINKAKSNQN